MLQKSGDSKYVRIYHPNKCLTTMYKTISRVARRISTSLEEPNKKVVTLEINVTRIN